MTSDVAKTSSVPVYQAGTDWESLINESDEILGYDLARDETADDLVGVPFLVTKAVFRPGIVRDKVQQAYVSCEIRIAPTLDIRQINTRRESSRLARITSLEYLAFGPDSHLVFNDGSTGVYRQIVKYLYMKKFIELNEPVIDVGGYGESSFDQPPSGWRKVLAGETVDIPGNKQVFTGYSANIRLYCPRGLRLSIYENDYTQNSTGKTRYIG